MKAIAITLLAILSVALAGCNKGSMKDDPPAYIDPNIPPSGKVVDAVRVVKVTARKYQFEPSSIVVRQGESVRLELTSADVTHGFALPAYFIDVRIEPGKTREVNFVATDPGTYGFACSVFCGIGHTGMKGTLVVTPASPSPRQPKPEQ